MINCPRCSEGGHQHRSEEPITGGWRTGSCGRRYKMVPARSSRNRGYWPAVGQLPLMREAA